MRLSEAVHASLIHASDANRASVAPEKQKPAEAGSMAGDSIGKRHWRQYSVPQWRTIVKDSFGGSKQHIPLRGVAGNHVPDSQDLVRWHRKLGEQFIHFVKRVGLGVRL